jgi:phosphatidylserine/phosphatidylglycerophosphate/cardiolipin synthase-like enzyme
MRRLLKLVFVAACTVPNAHAFDAAREIPATGTIQYAFSPDGGAARLIVSAIDGARMQVLVQSYVFTHKDIARALIHARRRGVDIQVIADAEQASRVEQQVLSLLKREGVGVWLDAQHSAAHNKVVLVDAGAQEATLITGSYNFTFAAEQFNAENLLIFRGNAALTRAFFENWQTHRAHASAFAPN